MDQNQKKNIVPGLILIGLGILFLLQNFMRNYNIDVGDWFVLGMGLVFIVAYFTKRKTGFLVAGLIISYLGSFILLNNLHIVDRQLFWAIFLMTLGFIFLIVYFFRKELGFVFPGLFLSAIGVYSLVLKITHTTQARMWPLFFMILAMACLLLFVFEFKRWGFKPLIPSLLLFAVGLLGFMTIQGMISYDMWIEYLYYARNFWPVLLVFAGVVIIIKNYRIKQ